MMESNNTVVQHNALNGPAVQTMPDGPVGMYLRRGSPHGVADKVALNLKLCSPMILPASCAHLDKQMAAKPSNHVSRLPRGRGGMFNLRSLNATVRLQGPGLLVSQPPLWTGRREKRYN